MAGNEKQGEFLTLSFLEELRHLCSKIGYQFSDFEVELDNLRLSLANPNLHDFQKELVGRLRAVGPGQYPTPLRLMAATADIKVSHVAFEAAVRLFPNERWILTWREKIVREWEPGKGDRQLSGYGA